MITKSPKAKNKFWYLSHRAWPLIRLYKQLEALVDAVGGRTAGAPGRRG